jgi:hypothetical protein
MHLLSTWLKGEQKALQRFSMLGVVALAFALRLYRLDYQSIWWDEGRNIAASLLPLWAITSAPGMDIHPPLYFYLLHFWLSLVGQTELAARFLSLVFSLLTVALLFQMGRRLFHPSLGLIGSFLVALSPLMIHEAQEARMYTLTLFLSTLSFYLLWRAWQEGKSYLWAGYTLSATLALYAHYAFAFVLISQNLLGGLLLARQRDHLRSLQRWVASQVGILVLYLPQLRTAIGQAISYENPNLVPPTLASFISQTWQAFNLDLTIEPERAVPLGAMIGVIIIAGLITGALRWREKETTPLSTTALWLLVPLILYYLLLQERSMFHPRYAILVTPAYFILLAYALWQIWRYAKVMGVLSCGLVVSSLLIGVHSYYFNPPFFRDDTRGLADFIQGRATSEDIVILDMPYPFAYYYKGPAPARYLFADIHTVSETLTSLTQGRDRLYLVQWYKSDSDPRGVIPFLLEKYCLFLGEEQFRGYQVAWYQLPPSPSFSLAPEVEASQVNFGDRLALTGFAFGGREEGTSDEAETARKRVPAGQKAWVVLEWQLKQKVSEDYKVTIYLEDRWGHLVGQDDRLLIDDTHLRTSNWEVGEVAINVYLIPVAAGTPPGEYLLKAAVYEPSTMERLPLLGSNGKPGGTSFHLGSLTVVKPSNPPSSLQIQHPLYMEFEEVALLGYDLAQGSVSQGETLTLALWWQALRDVEGDYLIHLQVEDKAGEIWGEVQSRPASGSYPTTEWEKGEILRDWYDLWIAPGTPPGEKRVLLRLLDGRTKEPRGELLLASLNVEGRSRLFTPPPIDNPLEAYLGEEVKLLGYDLNTKTMQPGETIYLTLYWQALAEMEESYTVFTHLLDEGDRIWGQKDSIPGGGALPTTGWLPGEIIADEYVIPVDPQAPEGEYILEVGIYLAETGQRLPVRYPSGAQENRVILATVQIASP